MRKLWPFPCDLVDPAALYAELPCAGTRPAVRLNMIASIDGATAVAGVSGGLGGPADQTVFAAVNKGESQSSLHERETTAMGRHMGP